MKSAGILRASGVGALALTLIAVGLGSTDGSTASAAEPGVGDPQLVLIESAHATGKTAVIGDGAFPITSRNRLDIDGDFAAELPEGELAAGTVVSELSGTGVPGTQVRVEREGDEAASNAPAGVMAVGLAAAVTQAAPAESATVAEDGTWRIRLAEPISAAGTHSLSVVPSIGTPDGEPLTTSFTIPAAAGGGAGGAQPGGADGGGTGDGSDAGDPGPGGTSGADAAEPDADGLATTGLGMGVWLVLLAGLVVGGPGMLLVRARRRT